MDRLVHSVILQGWPSVAKALRELKKKKHTKDGFYPVVDDTGLGEQYHVRVYQTDVKSQETVAK